MKIGPNEKFVLIGDSVTDVGRARPVAERHVLPDVYEETLEALIVWTRPLVKGLVIMTPVYWESNKQDLMAAKGMEYGAICKRLSEKQGVIFVDAQAYADKLLRYCHSSYISWDRVHPNVPGHHVLARALLDAIGFDFTHQS